MKALMILLLVVFVPGGIAIAVGKWLKHVREYSYPDIDFTPEETKPCCLEGRCGQECNCYARLDGHS